MPQNPEQIEQMMENLECTGDRVTKELILSRITQVDYQTVEIAGQKLMFCGIRMDTGFVVVGKPATCIDPSNWRDEIGQEISYTNSFSEIWKLEAYRKMAEQPTNEQQENMVELLRAELNEAVEYIEAELGQDWAELRMDTLKPHATLEAEDE